MGKKAGEVETFQSTRQLRINVSVMAITIVMYVLMSISIMHTASWFLSFTSSLIVVSLVGCVRAIKYAKVCVQFDSLKYATMVRTRVWKKTDLDSVCVETRNRGARKFDQPILKLKNGRKIALADFSVSVNDNRRVDGFNFRGEMEDLVSAIASWLST